MRRGLVFGKFLPFHLGHDALITFARSQCDHLTVLVCASERETIAEARRVRWLTEAYASDPGIEVKGFTYNERELPNSSVASRDISKLWAERFRTLLAPVDVVITAEPYGDFVAEFMGITHVRYQRQGDLSATKVRNDIITTWDSIHPCCRKDLVRKISILGTESTGKSTLTQRLAQHFGTTYVSEAGRDVVAETERCTWEDLGIIAHSHAERITDAMSKARRLLFIDTTVLTTVSYGRFLFAKELKVPPAVREVNESDLTLYLDSEAPYVQDGTRLDKRERDALDKSHRAVLDEAGVAYTVLRGSYQEREARAIQLVSALVPYA